MEGQIIEGVIEAADEKACHREAQEHGGDPAGDRDTPARGICKTKVRFRRAGLIWSHLRPSCPRCWTPVLPLDRSLNILSEISEQQGDERDRPVPAQIDPGGQLLFRRAPEASRSLLPVSTSIWSGPARPAACWTWSWSKLNEFLESTKELKDHVFSAMIYPTILCLTGGISIIILLTFVLPRFSVIFTELGSALPCRRRVLLDVSSALRSYGWVFLFRALRAVRSV